MKHEDHETQTKLSTDVIKIKPHLKKCQSSKHANMSHERYESASMHEPLAAYIDTAFQANPVNESVV